MKGFVEKLIKHFKTHEYCSEWIAVGDVITIINKLTEEYNNGWSPCSERLPDSSGNVIIMTRSSIVGVGSFFKNTSGWVQWYSGGIAIDVIAWQPLPEPYKELTT